MLLTTVPLENMFSTSQPNSTLSGQTVNGTGASEPGLDQTVDLVVRLSLILVVFITMVSLGCTLEISRIKEHVMKPKGVLIAIAGQYGIMPLTGFCLAKLFHLGLLESIAVLICGCCPGGNVSNIFSLALRGDMNLSILMTTCSTALALAMMPLLLYLYCKGFAKLEHLVPYTNITVALALTLVPCAIGIFINYRAPKYSKNIVRVGIGLMTVFFVVIGILAGITEGATVFRVTSSKLLAIAALMPLMGYTCGYILASLFGMNDRCRRTVSMEVGCQNIQLCATILKVAFPPEVIGHLYLFPVVYVAFQLTEGILIVCLFRCYQRLWQT